MSRVWTPPRTTASALEREGVDVRLRDGGRALLRPLDGAEREPLLAVFDAMSSRSRADRYLVAMERLSTAMVTALTDVDGRRHVSWLASVDGVPAGIARYVLAGSGVAEVAFEVVDAHQGRGLGAALLDAVTTVAAARGVRRLRATVHPANAVSRHLVGHLGIPLAFNDGVLEGEGALRLLEPARVDRRAVLELVCVGASPLSTAGERW
ncbi:MAG: GNAT family N-acetyltransferase [Nocardioidaceae bacterium]